MICRHQKNKLSGIKDQIQKEEEEAEETENEKTLTSEPVKKDPRKGFMKLLKEGSVPLIMGEKKVSDLPINIVYGKKDTTECMEFYEPKRCGKRIR